MPINIHPNFRKLLKLEELGFQPYRTDFSTTTNLKNLKQTLTKLPINAFPITFIQKIAGRIKQIRRFKKLIFAVLQDASTDCQILFLMVDFDIKHQTLIKSLDRGDLIGINAGYFKYTKTNELTLVVKKFLLLTKVLQVLPEKYHGLSDTETRYRQRYVDLLMNPQVYATFQMRSQIISSIHQFLQAQAFVPVETPLLHPVLGGATAKPFKTHHNALDLPLYLRVAPELYLKRLLVGRFERVYELGRLFRNEGLSTKHNPEFTALEIYQAYANMETMMVLLEKLLKALVQTIKHQLTFTYQGIELDFNQPFQRVTMLAAVKQFTKLDFTQVSLKQALNWAQEHQIPLLKHQQTTGHILNCFFEKYVENNLIKPTFIYQYPVEISPLARSDPKLVGFTERFELFIAKREYANAFSELNDPREQLKRFQQQLKERDLGNEEANEIDYDYIRALEYGLPPSGGLGIGIDRLIMLLTDQKSITDVILFPTLKPAPIEIILKPTQVEKE